MYPSSLLSNLEGTANNLDMQLSTLTQVPCICLCAEWLALYPAVSKADPETSISLRVILLKSVCQLCAAAAAAAVETLQAQHMCTC